MARNLGGSWAAGTAVAHSTGVPRVVLTLSLFLAGCHLVDDALAPRVDGVSIPAGQPVLTAPGYRIEPALTLLNAPRAIALDPASNLYVAEDGRPGDPAAPPRILRVSPAGHVDVLSEQLPAPVKRLAWHAGKLVAWHDEGTVTCFGGDGERCAAPPGLQERNDSIPFMIADEDGWRRVVRRRTDGLVLFAPAPGSERSPVALAISADGRSLYVADQGPRGESESGVIWRIIPEGAVCDGPPAGLSPPQQVGAPPTATRPANVQDGP